MVREMRIKSCSAAIVCALVVAWGSEAHAATLRFVALRGGTILIEGTRYRTVPELRVKLLQIKGRTPRPAIVLKMEGGASFKDEMHAIELVAKTGVFPKIGFLTEPSPR